MGRTLIFHIDVNSAYLSWEAVRRLKEGAKEDLRLIPSAVGGDREKRHGIILAKSPAAKKFGIYTSEPIVSALKKCPHLVLVSPDFSLYEKNSRGFMEILKRYAPAVEQYSIDEAFADMTGTEQLYGSPVEAARKIRDTIYEEMGFTVNVGISTNKLLAKMASDFEKPNKIHTLYPEEIQKKMWPLPVERLFLVGESARRRLNDLGIFTIGDLAKADPAFIRQHLKKHGEVIYKYANGIGETKITHMEPDNKGYSNSTTLAEDVADADTAKMVLLSLCETVCARLRKDGMKSGCIAVQLTYHTFQNRTHQCTLPTLTNVTGEVASIAFQLFDQMWDGNTPIRLLGVAAQKVTGDSIRQYNLFDLDKYEKMEKLDAAIDKIRGKYGETSITRACFMKKEMPKGWRGQK
ncbi:MAG TPA: DNA polymerase IV [Candidatus Fimimorpha excrementavium]|nr:DNA polymerase IV [Candidatus Fimimorpha excrementavium]